MVGLKDNSLLSLDTCKIYIEKFLWKQICFKGSLTYIPQSEIIMDGYKRQLQTIDFPLKGMAYKRKYFSFKLPTQG